VLAAFPALSPAQYGRTRIPQPNATAVAGAYNEPAATMHGVLKRITKKDIVILVDDDRPVTMDRVRKTKFFKDGKEVQPEQLAMGSIVSVDVGKDPQLTPLALNVRVDAPPIDEEAVKQAKAAATKTDPNPDIPEEDPGSKPK
jgi:hypothetical protein